MRDQIARMSVRDAAVGAPATHANGAAAGAIAGDGLPHAPGSLRWSKATRDCPTA